MALRWQTVENDPQCALFDDQAVGIVERHIGTGEYRGMEFLHVNARTIINRVPAQSRMPFEYTMVVWKDDSIRRPDMVFG